ncbi:serine hydrolase [Arthrobacter castelli]|uniref:serine hydrolase n=1 Tax=Arthrobacter castelli TaxID=271431 RepID=UPI000429D034|nr:serine hydrolase [Arthrobacter castelli]
MPVLSDYSDGVPAISYCLLDPAGNILASRNAGTGFYAASTMKLAVLVAAVQEVERGGLRLDQQLISQDTFTSAIGGAGDFAFDPEEADPGMPPPGAKVSLNEVLRRMITVSSNEATNMVVELVGLDSINAALRNCGASDSKMERLIGDLPARGAGRTCDVTARDLTAVLHSIITGAAAGPVGTELMLELLRAQQIGIIGPAFPPGTEWGSKSGWVDGIRHDVAFFQPANGSAVGSYVLAVCTRAYQQDEADEAIQSIAALSADVLLVD